MRRCPWHEYITKVSNTPPKHSSLVWWGKWLCWEAHGRQFSVVSKPKSWELQAAPQAYHSPKKTNCQQSEGAWHWILPSPASRWECFPLRLLLCPGSTISRRPKAPPELEAMVCFCKPLSYGIYYSSIWDIGRCSQMKNTARFSILSRGGWGRGKGLGEWRRSQL